MFFVFRKKKRRKTIKTRKNIWAIFSPPVYFPPANTLIENGIKFKARLKFRYFRRWNTITTLWLKYKLFPVSVQ